MLHMSGSVCRRCCLRLERRRIRRRKSAAITAALSALVTLGAVVPLYSLVMAAHREGTSISWRQHLHLTAIGPTAMPDETAFVCRRWGQKLYADIYLPDRQVYPSPWPTVFMMHGGGFIRGSRSDGATGTDGSPNAATRCSMSIIGWHRRSRGIWQRQMLYAQWPG